MSRVRHLFWLLALIGVAAQAAQSDLEAARQAIEARDFASAAAIYQTLAAQGNAKAQYNLGQMFWHGEGVARDADQALAWYRKSAEAGYAEAQYTLASLHFRRLARLPEDAEAVAWYRRAAEQGHVKSQLNLGDLYFKGEVVAPDIDAAMDWYRKASSGGSGLARQHLGVIYAQGLGATQDAVTGAMWLLLAEDALEPAQRARNTQLLNFALSRITPEQAEIARQRGVACRTGGYSQC